MGILDATLQGNLWANPGHIVIFLVSLCPELDKSLRWYLFEITQKKHHEAILSALNLNPPYLGWNPNGEICEIPRCYPAW